jgi:hypothetical protein
MSYELRSCAAAGNLERVKELVEGGANIEETDNVGMTPLLRASLESQFKVVVYLVELGANVKHIARNCLTALLCAAMSTFPLNLSTVTYLVEHGARITDRCSKNKSPLLYAALNGSLEMVKYFLSAAVGSSITEIDDAGNTALLVAAGTTCHPSVVMWLLEFGGAQIMDTNKYGVSIWTSCLETDLASSLLRAYTKTDTGEYIPNLTTPALTSMLRVMVLYGGPPESFVKTLSPPFQRIVQDGARLKAQLPAYLAQRRALLDAHCPLLPPLQDLVLGYEEPTTTEDIWATCR